MTKPWLITGYRVKYYATVDRTGLIWALNDPNGDKIGVETGEVARFIAVGATYWDLLHEDPPLHDAQASVDAYLMSYDEWLSRTENGETLKAVTGGYVMISDSTSSAPWVREHRWGVSDGEGQEIAMFYRNNSSETTRFMAIFDDVNVAPVINFWSGEKIIYGPNVASEKELMLWHINESHQTHEENDYHVSLAQVVDVVILETTFLHLDNPQKEVTLIAAYTQTAVNETSTQQSFIFKFGDNFAQSSKHTFKGGFKIGAKVELKVGIPAATVATGTATSSVDTSFEWGKEDGTIQSYSFAFDVPVVVPPGRWVKCVGTYHKGHLSTNAMYTVQYTYKGGTKQVVRLPVVVKTDNAFNGTTNFTEGCVPYTGDGPVKFLGS